MSSPELGQNACVPWLTPRTERASDVTKVANDALPLSHMRCVPPKTNHVTTHGSVSKLKPTPTMPSGGTDMPGSGCLVSTTVRGPLRVVVCASRQERERARVHLARHMDVSCCA
jgi:hypothetical protein